MARGYTALAHTRRTASSSPKAPRAPSTVVANPASEVSSSSSVVPLERTASPQGANGSASAHSVASSARSSFGKGDVSRRSRARAARSTPRGVPASLSSEAMSWPLGSVFSTARSNQRASSTQPRGTG
jgi:hypothetical protein